MISFLRMFHQLLFLLFLLLLLFLALCKFLILGICKLPEISWKLWHDDDDSSSAATAQSVAMQCKAVQFKLHSHAQAVALQLWHTCFSLVQLATCVGNISHLQLYYTVLQYIALHCTTQHFTTLHYPTLTHHTPHAPLGGAITIKNVVKGADWGRSSKQR